MESCSRLDSDVAPTRRLTADVDAADAAAPSLHRPPRAAPSLASYKAAQDAALAADMEVRKAELAEEMTSMQPTRQPSSQPSAQPSVQPSMQPTRQPSSLNATGSEGSTCNATTTFYYFDGDANVDLSPCYDSLKKLIVVNADFAPIGPQLKYMVNLQLLKTYYAWNAFLPDELADLKQLTHLVMQGTHLGAWPAVLQRMPQLTHLVLSVASLYMWPTWLGKLRNLVHLDLSYNYLYDIGDDIGGLKSLQTLLASFSLVQSVSPSINRLSRLRALDLSNSYSLRLPATLAELNELESVQLEGSSFQCVPDAVRAMPLFANQTYFDETPACEAVPRPISYSQTRNDACLWNAYYGFWYKAACDGTLRLRFCVIARAHLTHLSFFLLLFSHCRCEGQAVRDNVR
jgi:hypothetical protein